MKSLVVACQGGGSHCAFGAGVLAEILARLDDSHALTWNGERYRLSGLSGTSGGALNALLAWSGLLPGHSPRQGVEALHQFWRKMSAYTLPDAVANFWTVQSLRMRDVLPHLEVAPNAVSGWAHDRVRAHLEELVPFAQLDAARVRQAPKLLVGAAAVLSGDFTVFGCKREVPRVEHFLASTAVPTFYEPVKIGGEYYWDGLLSQNPPVRDFLRACDLDEKPDAIWVIRINPREHLGVPRRISDITDRQNEMAGNLSLEQERLFIEQVNHWVDKGQLQGPYKNVEWAEIELDAKSESGDRLDYASKLDRDPAFIESLIEHGRDKAAHFMDA